jgi:hypothetical protein
VRRGKAYRRGGKSRGIQSGGAAPSAIDQPIPAHATGGGSPKSASLSARATRCSADNCSHRAASSSSARSATSGLSPIRALPRAVAPLFLGRAQSHTGNVTVVEPGSHEGHIDKPRRPPRSPAEAGLASPQTSLGTSAN